MRLTKEQSNAVYDLLVKDQATKYRKKKIKEIAKSNQLLINEAIDKFKETEEYKAIMLLYTTFPKRFPKSELKNKIEILALEMFNVKLKSKYIDFYTERSNIELLSIDCKNLEELKNKLKEYYEI